METGAKRIFNRFFILIFFVEALQATVTQMLNTTMAQFVQSLGGDTALAGAISSGLTVVMLALSLLCGSLADRYGRRPVLLIGLVIAAAAMVACGGFIALPAFVVFRALQTGGCAAANSCDGAVVADVVPLARLGEASGYFGFAQSLSTAVGPALGLALAAAWGYRWLYFVSAIALGAAVVLTLLCDYERKGLGNPRPAPEAAPKERNFLLRFIEPKALPASIIQFCYFVAAAFTVYYLATYAETFSIDYVSLFYPASAIGMLVSRLFSGRLADKLGPLPVVAAGAALGILSYVGILFARQSGVLMPVSGGVYGFALGLITPPLQASAIRVSSDSRRGVATSTFIVSITVGLGVGGALFGLTIAHLGYVGSLMAGAALMVLSLVLALVFLRKLKAAEK